MGPLGKQERDRTSQVHATLTTVLTPVREGEGRLDHQAVRNTSASLEEERLPYGVRGTEWTDVQAQCLGICALACTDGAQGGRLSAVHRLKLQAFRDRVTLK